MTISEPTPGAGWLSPQDAEALLNADVETGRVNGGTDVLQRLNHRGFVYQIEGDTGKLTHDGRQARRRLIQERKSRTVRA